MLLFMNHCNDFAPCGPSIGQYNSYSYSYMHADLNFKLVRVIYTLREKTKCM